MATEVVRATAPVDAVSQLRRPRWLPTVPRWVWWLVAGAMLIGLGVHVGLSDRKELAGAWEALTDIDASWLIVAIVAEVLSFVAFAEAQRRLLVAAGQPVGLGTMTAMATAFQALTCAIPAGAAAGAVYVFRQLRRRGVGAVVSSEVQAVSAALFGAVLCVLVFLGAAIAGDSGRHVPDLLPAAGGLLGGVLLVGIALVIAARRGKVARLRALVHRLYAPSEASPGRIFHLGRSGWAAVTVALAATWLFDATCLAVSFLAVHGDIPWRGLLVAYGAGQLAAMLPLTPGGLGVVEGSLTGALVAFLPHHSTSAQLALAAVLLYRFFAYWAVFPAGLAAHIVLRRRRDPLPTQHPIG